MKSKKNRTLDKDKTRKIYSRKHYESDNGMLTKVWGPSMWHYLHTMSFNYPVHPSSENKMNYRDFVLSLYKVLPCGKCRENLQKNFKKLPLRLSDMKSRETFSRYIYKLHELVNKMLGKKSGLSYHDVRERYEHFRARCIDGLQTETLKIENGCTEPLYGKKRKCVLTIVPEETKCDTLIIK